MKILQFSDLHGRHTRDAQRLIQAHAPDWIVLTGDILPDFHMIGGLDSRMECQRQWWSAYRHAFLRPGLVTTFTLGNHELEGFQDPELIGAPRPLLGRLGVLQGSPAEFGAWGYAREYGPDQLQAEVEALDHPLVLLSHCPPLGRLDATWEGDRIGHPPLRQYLDETLDAPLLLLCGHVHESFGQIRQGRTLIVNAATGYALLDLDLGFGLARVIKMSRLKIPHYEVS